MRHARFASFHADAGRHEQIGRPLYLLTQPGQNGRRSLGNAIVAVLLSHSVSENAEPVAAVGETPRDHARPLQRVQDAQQAGLGDRGCAWISCSDEIGSECRNLRT